MPKPVKKSAKKAPVKAKRPSSDPNRRAHQMLAEHMSLVTGSTVTPPHGDPLADPVRAYMSKIGKKGGKIGGKRRLETMTSAERSEVAFKAAQARWGTKKR